MGERSVRIREVMGSNPTVSTKRKELRKAGFFSFDIECREDSKFMPRGKSHCFVLFFAEGFFLDKDGDFVIISLFPEGVASAFRRAASRHTG